MPAWLVGYTDNFLSEEQTSKDQDCPTRIVCAKRKSSFYNSRVPWGVCKNAYRSNCSSVKYPHLQEIRPRSV